MEVVVALAEAVADPPAAPVPLLNTPPPAPPKALSVAVTVFAPVRTTELLAAPPVAPAVAPLPPAPAVASLPPLRRLACVLLAVVSLKVRLEVAAPAAPPVAPLLLPPLPPIAIWLRSI